MSLIKGLLIGFTVGILVAPDRGSATRKKIADSFKEHEEDAKDYLNDKANAVKSKAQNVVSSLKEKAKDVADNAKSNYQDFKHDVRNA